MDNITAISQIVIDHFLEVTGVYNLNLGMNLNHLIDIIQTIIEQKLSTHMDRILIITNQVVVQFMKAICQI